MVELIRLMGCEASAARVGFVVLYIYIYIYTCIFFISIPSPPPPPPPAPVPSSLVANFDHV